MAYSVIATASFGRELDRIIEYHLTVLDARIALSNLLEKLDNARTILAEFPEIKAISTKPTLNDLQLREWLLGNYVLVYRVDGSTIYFEHIFHQRQDFERFV